MIKLIKFKRIYGLIIFINFLFSCQSKNIDGNWYIIDESDYYTEWYLNNGRMIYYSDVIEEFIGPLNYDIINDSLIIFNPREGNRHIWKYLIKQNERNKVGLIHENGELELVRFELRIDIVQKIFDGTISDNEDKFIKSFYKRREEHKTDKK